MARNRVSGQFSLTRLSLCLGLAFGGGGAWAQDAAVQPVATLKEVVISGSRVEQDIDDVPVTMTTIGADDVARRNSSDLADLLKDEVGVSVRVLPYLPSFGGNSGRGGNEGVNIRGLEGDQVRMQVDGVSLPGTYSSGPYYAGRGETLEPEGYKRVEIMRGASSTQYGSDGLAGAVSFVTKDPQDLLTLGNATQFNVKTGYSSLDRSWNLAPSFAFKGDTVQGMVLASMRQGSEASNMGSNDSVSVNRTASNPASKRSDYILAKLLLTPSHTHHFKLTAETIDRTSDTDVLSQVGANSTQVPALITSFKATDNVARDLLKLDYRYAPSASWFDLLTASIYNQKSTNQQLTGEWRANNPLYRSRDTLYAENTVGGSLQLESNLGQETLHRLVYGVDATLADITSLKLGYNTPRNLAFTGCATGTTCSPFVTAKSFPDTDYRTLGMFVQDEITMGTVSVTPGVRFDSFKFTPKPDALYRAQNTAATSELGASAVSPKLGVVWKMAPLAQPFAQYSRGFRAPSASQINGGVTNTSYTSIGNPDIKSETSDSIELGVRGRDASRSYSLAIFHGKYKDFIASNVLMQDNTAPTLDIYQSINLGSVTISGFEARGAWAFAKGWSVSAAYAHAEGTTEANGVQTPLATLDPDKILLGMRYENGARWGAESLLKVVERKQGTFQSGSPATTKISVAEGYAVMDISGWYAFSKKTRLNASVGNLFDQKYLEWADVRDLDSTSTLVNAYTQPGRNFKVSLTHSF